MLPIVCGKKLFAAVRSRSQTKRRRLHERLMWRNGRRGVGSQDCTIAMMNGGRREGVSMQRNSAQLKRIAKGAHGTARSKNHMGDGARSGSQRQKATHQSDDPELVRLSRG